MLFKLPRREVPLPSSKLIPELKEQLAATGDADQQWERRTRLAKALEEAAAFDEAAAAIAPNIFAPLPKGKIEPFSSSAVTWAIDRRRAQTLRAFEGHFEKFLKVSRTLEIRPNWRMLNHPESLQGRKYEGPTPDEIIVPLSAMGPDVLGLLFDVLPPIAGRNDSTPTYVRIVENVGAGEDAPILIYMLARIIEDDKARHAPGEPDRSVEKAELAAAIEHALETLTGAKVPTTASAGQLTYWQEWWTKNARRIVLGKG